MATEATEGPPGAASGSILAPAVRGSLWALGGHLVGQAIRLAGNLVLTRLLFPAVFGEMALVFIFIQGLQMFSDVGSGPAIVRSPRGADPAFLDTAWTVQAGRGLLLWLASWAVAWPAAAFYGQPALRWLIPVAGLTALMGGLESTAMYGLQRELRLERLTVTELVSQASGMAVSIALAALDRAVAGPGDPRAAWALVTGSLVASATRLVLSHRYLPGARSHLRLERDALRELLHFGRWIFVSTVLAFLAGQLDRLVLGKFASLSVLGVYSVAAMLATLPTQAILKVGSAVVFPTYSRLGARADFPEVFLRVRGPLLLGGGALCGALIAAGPHLVDLLYDSRYRDAGWILQFLAAGAWFQVLECTNGAALLARGQTRWVAAGSAVKVVGLIAGIPIGFHL